MDTSELGRIVEALLFVSDVPLKLERLIEITGAERARVKQALEQLSGEMEEAGRGIQLAEVGGGFQLRSKPECAEWIRMLSSTRPFRFSRAALESLAIIAYRQPITRAEIDYLRGVDSGGVVKTLLDKRLIRILGKKDVPGRPLIYGTTREFLELFGLHDLSALPTLKEFSELVLDDEQELGTPGPNAGSMPASEEEI